MLDFDKGLFELKSTHPIFSDLDLLFWLFLVFLETTRISFKNYNKFLKTTKIDKLILETNSFMSIS